MKMKVKPTKGRVLIRVEMPEFSSITLVAGTTPEGETNYRLYVDDLPDNDDVSERMGVIVGQEVLLEAHSFSGPDNKILIEGNENSFNVLHNHIKQLTTQEVRDFKKANPTVSVVEYMLINTVDIRAIVTRQ